MKCRFFLIFFGLTWVSVSVEAETFYLKDGSVIKGAILRSLGNTLSIKLENKGMHQLPESEVDRVEIAITDGERIVGSLTRWVDGVYLLVTNQGLVEVKNGVVTRIVDDSETADAETQAVPVNVGEETAPAPAASSLREEQQPQKFEPTM